MVNIRLSENFLAISSHETLFMLAGVGCADEEKLKVLVC